MFHASRLAPTSIKSVVAALAHTRPTALNDSRKRKPRDVTHLFFFSRNLYENLSSRCSFIIEISLLILNVHSSTESVGLIPCWWRPLKRVFRATSNQLIQSPPLTHGYLLNYIFYIILLKQYHCRRYETSYIYTIAWIIFISIANQIHWQQTV